MKIALVSDGESLDSKISEAMGRCAFFVFVNTENKKIIDFYSKENTAKDQHGGAGITAGQIVANESIDSLIVKNIGPRGFSVFEKLNIKIYKGFDGSIKENVEKLLKDELESFGTPVRRGMHK